MHDNTCKTNCYNCPLSFFVTPDNNLKTRIIAQAIVDDKTQFSYEWVFQCVNEITGISLRVFVTMAILQLMLQLQYNFSILFTYIVFDI